MDFDFDKVPSWARTWCFYFLGIAIFSIFIAILVLFNYKKLGITVALLYVLAALVQAATAKTLFWMCRKSLQ